MGALGRLDVRRERSGPLDHPGHGHAFEERPTSTRVKRRGTWMLLGEAGHLAGHQAGEAVAIEAGFVRHGPSMAGQSRCRAAIPPRATRSGLVDPADEAADMAGGQPGVGVDIEEAGTAVGAAEEAARCGRGMAAATHAPHRGSSSGDGRSGGSGHHGGVRVCFLARRHRGMSDRLRGRGFVLQVLSNLDDGCLDVCAPGSGSVVWALEPSRRVGRVTQEVSGTGGVPSNARWSGGGWRSA